MAISCSRIDNCPPPVDNGHSRRRLPPSAAAGLD
ncbi:MAG: hypothetical protein [Siphoviridae sp. ctdEk19]|nr:MAG: hypothetical protein [Siphoviridae sp. ctdEk19]